MFDKKLYFIPMLFLLLFVLGCLNNANNSDLVDPSIPKYNENDPIEGNVDAPVTIVEFSDFQCPYCRKFYSQTLPKIREEYIDTGKVKFVFRNFPLSFHKYAQKAAEAAECANEQGKFWEMHDILYENSYSLSEESIKRYASQIGLNTEQFNECLDSGKYAEEVKKDFNDGVSLGVSGTPTFFINNKKVVGALPYEAFKKEIDRALLESSSKS